jgi:MFS family permease
MPDPTIEPIAPPEAAVLDYSAPPPALREARTLRELSPEQWKSGIAAWLGWLFDGLDMHLYTLVATPFVAILLHVGKSDPVVKEKAAFIQGAFLIGWALGGGFFGRLGDLIGRSRALSLTILTYATFTGLSCFAQTWWQLLIFRFIAALGIGGEWAVGSSLLSETWPKKWRPWIAAVLQTGVNLGVLLAASAAFLLAKLEPRYVFLFGAPPALIVFWIRKAVPEPAEWHAAKASAIASNEANRVHHLFQGAVLRITVLTILVCSFSLTAWWGFMFWISQHWVNLPEVRLWPETDQKRLVSEAFFAIIGTSIAGNFFAGWFARHIGYRRAISVMCLGMFVMMFGGFIVPRNHVSLMPWAIGTGFFSGGFGLFTMYLPPLFPTLLRTTGAGFSYNIGRIFAAIGTITFGLTAKAGDFRIALLCMAFLFLPAMLIAWMMPDLPDHETGSS